MMRERTSELEYSKVCNDRKQAILSSRDEREHAVIVIRVDGRKNVAVRPRIMQAPIDGRLCPREIFHLSSCWM